MVKMVILNDCIRKEKGHLWGPHEITAEEEFKNSMY